MGFRRRVRFSHTFAEMMRFDKSLANLEYILSSVAQNIDSITRNIDGTPRNMSEFSRLIRQNPGLLLNGGAPEADQGLTPASSAGQ